MKKKSKDSTTNLFLTGLLVICVCLLSFSIGVISGKGLSDEEYARRVVEEDEHYANQGSDEQGESTPASEDLTEKEVEVLTARAIKEAREGADNMGTMTALNDSVVDASEQNKEDTKDVKAVASTEGDKKPEPDKSKKGKDKTAADKVKDMVAKDEGKKKGEKRKTASLIPNKSTTPPKSSLIEYTVQVASYKTMEEAEDHSKKLIDKGFPAFPVRAKLKTGQIWYRVSIGSFKNKKQAINYQRDLKKQAIVKNSIVQKVLRE